MAQLPFRHCPHRLRSILATCSEPHHRNSNRHMQRCHRPPRFRLSNNNNSNKWERSRIPGEWRPLPDLCHPRSLPLRSPHQVNTPLLRSWCNLQRNNRRKHKIRMVSGEYRRNLDPRCLRRSPVLPTKHRRLLPRASDLLLPWPSRFGLRSNSLNKCNPSNCNWLWNSRGSLRNRSLNPSPSPHPHPLRIPPFFR